jgi:hypothetical protein
VTDVISAMAAPMMARMLAAPMMAAPAIAAVAMAAPLLKLEERRRINFYSQV